MSGRPLASKQAVLLVDDDLSFARRLALFLEKQRCHVVHAASGEEALETLQSMLPDIVLLDLLLPGIDGLEVLQRMRQAAETSVVIVMTGHSSIDAAVAAMRAGAHDFIAKPLDLDALSMKLAQARDLQGMRSDLGYMLSRDRASSRVDELVGECPSMQAVNEKVRLVAATPDTTVLITGQSGTGKGLVSRDIHNKSSRAHRPLMQIDCTTISPNLLESELFGHERGAFTGAERAKKGLLELADGGTLLLDEIGDMPLELQGKLLRLLQERSFRRVGGVRELEVDVRVIAATNQNLQQLVRDRRFREDLMFRLKVFQIALPPLCERGDDVMTLAWTFTRKYAESFRKPIRSISDDAEEALRAYPFPGNVRELQNVIEQAVILATGDSITAEVLSLPSPFSERAPRVRRESGGGVPALRLDDLGPRPLEAAERQLIHQALERAKGNKKRAAELLGISRYALQRRLDKLSGEGTTE